MSQKSREKPNVPSSKKGIHTPRLIRKNQVRLRSEVWVDVTDLTTLESSISHAEQEVLTEVAHHTRHIIYLPLPRGTLRHRQRHGVLSLCHTEGLDSCMQ